MVFGSKLGGRNDVALSAQPHARYVFFALAARYDYHFW
jgi:hypothetical protein